MRDMLFYAWHLLHLRCIDELCSIDSQLNLLLLLLRFHLLALHYVGFDRCVREFFLVLAILTTFKVQKLAVELVIFRKR